MSIESSPQSRLNYSGELEPVVADICSHYDLGAVEKLAVVEVGYEDCNVIITTEQGRFLAKMFAKGRSEAEIERYATTIGRVLEAGVNHPEALTASDASMVFRSHEIAMVVMRFVEGQTFYELGRLPDAAERRAIVEQAAKIHSIDYQPPFLFDSWAIPHIAQMYGKVQQFIAPDDLLLVDEVMQRYQLIPVDELPHAFVHGDIIKTNTIKADDGKLYLIDFSVANWYPRIQELAVMAANLLHEPGGLSLDSRCRQLTEDYMQCAELTAVERQHLLPYALAGIAIEFMGAHQEKHLNGHDNAETDYWLQLGREGLRAALK